MRHLMRYEGFSHSDRADEVLDKIHKYGIESITPEERQFMDSYKTGEEEEIHHKLTKMENEVVFEHDTLPIKFQLSEVKYLGEIKQLIGIIYVSDITLDNGKEISGRLEGMIITNDQTGEISADFSKDEYDIFDFCEGLEHELDSFLEYVVSEVESM